MTEEEFKQKLSEGLKASNIDYTDKNLDDFNKFKDLLLEWNEKINLTSITLPEEIITKHFLDSVSALSVLDYNNKTLIDVGTGAGFPSIPMKILRPDIKMTLLDSLQKRIKYLDNVILELGLENIETIHGRTEDFGQNPAYRGKYDIAISRAVATLPLLSEFCLPYVKTGGSFIALKGPNLLEEIREARPIIKVLGGEVEKIVDVDIPNLEAEHKIVVVKKLKATPKKFPRKPGTVKKNV